MSRWTALAVVPLVLLVACSVPIDESATVIDAEDLPEALQPGFTPTTTVGPDAPGPTTQTYVVFLLQQREGIEQRAVRDVERELEREASLETVIGTLFEQPPEFEEGLVSELASDRFELVDADHDDGVAEIDIVVIDVDTGEPAEDQTIDRDVLQDIAAQLVWTSTEYDESITAVRILIAGDEVALPTPGGQTEVGATVTRADYEVYDPDFEFSEPEPSEVTTTSTTTTSTTTTSTTTTSSTVPGG